MNATDVSTVARHLYLTQGGKAIAQAAQKAAELTKAGDSDQASFWQRVEAVLLEMQGPRQS
jgi:hypothetical protein